MPEEHHPLSAILADLRRQREDLQELLEQGKQSRRETDELIARIRILRESAEETSGPALIEELGEGPIEGQQ